MKLGIVLVAFALCTSSCGLFTLDEAYERWWEVTIAYHDADRQDVALCGPQPAPLRGT